MYLVEQVPVDDYVLPLGKAEILKEGKDATIVGWGSQMYAIEKAVNAAEKQMPGVSIEVIDLRSILPWDIETIEKVIYLTLKFIILVCQQDGKTRYLS
jgi:2-oxoisovalerate dehydrogenase E1 component beta subunit